jgi:vancomycin resistance protein VanJ
VSNSGAAGRLYGAFVIACSLALAALLLLHRFIPNRWFNAGSFIETFLPWFGLLIPPLLILAAIRRKPLVIIIALLPGLVWLKLYAGLLPDKSAGDGDFRVLAHNVHDENPDPAFTARSVLDADADIVALVELTEDQRGIYDAILSEHYEYAVYFGTVALWSAYPVVEADAIDLGLGWTRAFRARVDIDDQPVAVYVTHLLSVRVSGEGFTIDQRNRTAELLGEAIAAEPLDRVLLLGDLNGTVQDRSLAPITFQLDSAHAAAGKGFGFTWPASFPMARIDQVLFRGLEATDSRVLDAAGSDHRAVRADFDLGGGD